MHFICLAKLDHTEGLGLNPAGQKSFVKAIFSTSLSMKYLRACNAAHMQKLSIGKECSKLPEQKQSSDYQIEKIKKVLAHCSQVHKYFSSSHRN